MPLEKEYSMVADSTLASSPEPALDASETIKRAPKTYGKRRREDPIVEEAASSSSYVGWGLSQSESIHNTAPPGLKETIPTSSLPPSPGDDGDSALDASPVFKASFGWRDKLAGIDEDFDKQETAATPAKETHFGNAQLLLDNRIRTPATELNSNTRAPPLPRESDDVFGGLSSSPSHGITTGHSFALSSPAARRHKPNKRVIQDSDSEEELPKGSSSAAPSSSGPNLFETTEPRSPSTQPTTDDDELPSRLAKRRPSSAPRKLAAQRHSVPSPASPKVASHHVKKTSKGKKTKVKAPTKKEILETAKERGRIAAQTTVPVPRVEKPSKYTIGNLLSLLAGKPREVPASDPIEPFSSPGKSDAPSPQKVPEASPSRPSPVQHRAVSPDFPALPESDDEDLPEIGEILKQGNEKRQAEELLKLKRRALESAALKPSHNDDEDDDLVVDSNPKVAVKEEAENRRSAKKSRPSAARKMFVTLAHVNPAIQARKAALHSPSRLRKDPKLAESREELAQITLANAKRKALFERERKEEEWRKHGGRLVEQAVAPASDIKAAIKEIAGQRLELVKAGKSEVDEEMEGPSDEEDEDWAPELRGSASPEPEEEEGEIAEQEEDDNMLVDGDMTMVAEDTDDSEGDLTKVHVPRRNIVVSDSEDDENDENVPMKLATPNYRRASTSSGMGTEDDDKENKPNDQEEDKENTQVARLAPARLTRTPSIFDLAPPDRLSPAFGRNTSDEASPGIRKPFQDLLSESPKAVSFSPSRLTQSFEKLQPSALPSTLAPAPTLTLYLKGDSGSSNGLGGFSQFVDSEPDVFGAPALLGPSFSDEFEPTERVKSKSPEKLGRSLVDTASDEFSDENDHSRGLRRTDTLGLTQDVLNPDLKPAFKAEATKLRKADAVFEKEQEFVIEANTKRLARENTLLYVNDHGFLTQTRPTDGSPEIYRRPLQASSSFASVLSPAATIQTPQRIPFGDLSSSYSGFTEPSSPEGRPNRRLRRKGSPSARATSHSPSSSPPMRQPSPKMDAYTALMRGQEKAARKEAWKRKKAELGEFMEEEAAESDEDDRFGFAQNKAGDDEEDGEDLDKDLPELMDHSKMDEETVAADLVLEKHMEHLEQDDKLAQEYHEKATKGLMRNKRTRGVGVDNSDEESEDEGNDRARRAIKKLRVSDRGDIKGLAANPDTRAFAKSYNSSLQDDEELQLLPLQLGDIGGSTRDTARDEDEEEDEDEELQVETVGVHDVKAQLFEMNRAGLLGKPGFDTENVDWIDDEDVDMEEAALRVKTVNTKQHSRPQLDSSEFDSSLGPAFRTSTTEMSDKTKSWGAQETKSRNMGTARSVGGSAITGHARAKAKSGAGGGPTRKGQQPSGGASTSARPVKTSASFLSGIIRDFA